MRLKLSSVKNIAIFSGPVALAAAIALQSGAVHAQVTTDTWKSGITGNWSTGTNWVGNVAPTPGNTTSLFFNNVTTTAYMANNDIANPFSLNSLTLNNSNASNPTNPGLITLTGSQINFDGTNPTLNFNGTGNATINNTLLFDATSVIGGAGSGVLTLAGTISTATAQATNLSINDANGTINFNGTVNLNPSGIPATDQTGGNFFVTNGTVNINNGSNVFTANNLFYVGDSISSITNFTTGAGTTGTGANATLNIVNGNEVQNGRLAIGAFTGDKGTLTIASGASLQVNNGLDQGSTGGYFGGRLQLGGYGGTFDGSGNQAYGTANTTTGAASLILTGGQISVTSSIEVYTNGSITATNGSVIHTVAVADGNVAGSGVGGISLTNSFLYFDGAPVGNVLYSGNITGSGSTLTKQDNYTQILGGNDAIATIAENGGVLAITGNTTTTNINVSGTNQVPGTSPVRFQTGTLNVTGTASGTVTVGSNGVSGGTLSGTGTVGNIALKVGTVSPGGTAAAPTGVGDAKTLNATSLTWSSAASMNFDLNLGSNAAASNDLLNLTSFFNSDVANPTAKAYAFNFTTTGTFSGAPTTYNLVDYQTGNTNFAANASNFTATGIPTGLLGVFSFNGANNILQFTVSSAMPEPSALPFALAGFAPIGFMAFRRARHRAATASPVA